MVDLKPVLLLLVELEDDVLHTLLNAGFQTLRLLRKLSFELKPKLCKTTLGNTYRIDFVSQHRNFERLSLLLLVERLCRDLLSDDSEQLAHLILDRSVVLLDQLLLKVSHLLLVTVAKVQHLGVEVGSNL